MLITRETDYALRIMRALSDGELHTVGDIADVQMVPRQFTYKIIKKLSNAGMIQILRGSSGGCRLAADLDQASLYDLIMAMDDRMSVSACMQDGYVCQWKECNQVCRVHNKLEKIQSKLEDELKSHSLGSLINGD